jgi:hypothetical protein
VLSFGSPWVCLHCGLGYKLSAYRTATNYLGAAFSHWISSVGEIIKFSQRDQEVWECQCGNHTFWLYSGGDVVCAECEREVAWHDRLLARTEMRMKYAQDNPRGNLSFPPVRVHTDFILPAII